MEKRRPKPGTMNGQIEGLSDWLYMVDDGEERQKLTKCSPCNTGKMSYRESELKQNTVKWVTLSQKNYKFSGGLLKPWELRELFMWKSSVEVGDMSLELGQKFRAGDGDLAIKSETTEIKGVEKNCQKRARVLKMKSWVTSQALQNMLQELLSDVAHTEKRACSVSDILLPQRSIRHWLTFKELIFLVGKPPCKQTNAV